MYLVNIKISLIVEITARSYAFRDDRTVLAVATLVLISYSAHLEGQFVYGE